MLIIIHSLSENSSDEDLPRESGCAVASKHHNQRYGNDMIYGRLEMNVHDETNQHCMTESGKEWRLCFGRWMHQCCTS